MILMLKKVVIIAFLGLFIGLNVVIYADNPIIPNQGVCDPHIHIFNNKAYLFSTHDYAPGMPIYTMYDWQVFSSPDLVTWTKEFVLRPENAFIGPSSICYATDGATRNGKYYFYFSKGQECTGVAVSTNGPGGPYTDALGAPLLPSNLTPTAEYDPTVFIDDDANQTPYIIFGYTVVGQQYYIARLNNDMISLAESPSPITINNGWANDATWVHKRNGIYYLNSHGSCYATSTNIYGPYTNRGTFCYDALVDHGTFFTWHNQNFFTYGVPNNWGDPNVDYFYRKTKIVYNHYKDNGDIVDDPFIEQSSLGVGQYDATWNKIQAEWYFGASDGLSKRENATGFEIRTITNNAYLYFPKFRNLTANASLSFYVSSANSGGGTIEVRQDSATGTLLGSCAVPNTGSWTTYQTVNCNLSNSAGTKEIYLVFKGSGTELMRLDWFRTNSSVVLTRYEAENASLSGGCGVNTNHTGYSGTGFVDRYMTAGATTTFTVNASSAGGRDVILRYSAGAGSQSLGLYVNGTKIKDTSLPATADWETWADKTETLSLNAGNNTIAYKAEASNIPVNIDYIDAPGGPAGYTWCANENQAYTLPGTCDVAYGANGAFNYKYSQTGTITFNNATFGDPIIGVVKAGYYKSSFAKAWEFASNTESWTAPNQISGFAWQTGGYVGGTVTGGDPYMVSGDGLGVAITNNKIIKVRLKNSTSASSGQIYFITNADPVWNEAKHKDFTINANDANYTEYTIDMSTVAGWTGTLKQLRLDPEAGATSGSFSVDYLRILN